MTVSSSERHHHLHSPHPHDSHHHPHNTHLHHDSYHHHHPAMTHDHNREHDVHGLRLALGSILSPKRMSTPNSHASSGTASPCPAHFGPGLVHPYHPTHLHTPIEAQEEADAPKRPALLHEDSGTNVHDPMGAQQRSRERPHNTSPPPILTTSNVHSLSSRQTESVKESRKDQAEPDGSTLIRHPSTKDKRERDGRENLEPVGQRGINAYIATLQSKRAWDALVHGNMS